jgi:hypothetical protein
MKNWKKKILWQLWKKNWKRKRFFFFLFVFKEKENFFRLLSRSMKVVATFLTVFLFSKTFTFLLFFLHFFYLIGCITKKLAFQKLLQKLLPKQFEIIFFLFFWCVPFGYLYFLLFPLFECYGQHRLHRSIIQCWGLNSQPLDHESSALTTRPVFLNLFLYAEPFWRTKMSAEPLLAKSIIGGTLLEFNFIEISCNL